MSDTDRTIILAKREAYREGVLDARSTDYALRWSGEAIERRAKRKYPLPTVTRPRIVKDEEGDEFRWRAATGLEFRFRGGAWTTGGYYVTTDNQRRLVADLLVRPTEEVEADE